MRGLRLAVLWAVPLLYASKVCDEAILSEGIAAMADDLGCVRDVKLCLQHGTCADAGVSSARMCECYRQVEARCGAHAYHDAYVSTCRASRVAGVAAAQRSGAR